MQIFTKRGTHAPTFLYTVKGCYKTADNCNSMAMFGGDLLCQHVKLVSGT